MSLRKQGRAKHYDVFLELNVSLSTPIKQIYRKNKSKIIYCFFISSVDNFHRLQNIHTVVVKYSGPQRAVVIDYCTILTTNLSFHYVQGKILLQ